MCTRGNHDEWVAQLIRAGRSLHEAPLVERTWALCNAGKLDAADASWLEQFPTSLTVELDMISYGLTHLYRGYEEIVSLLAFADFSEQAFGCRDMTSLIFGHTHRQSIRWLSNQHCWLNSGSASYRRRDDPDQRAHYATITDGRLALHRLPYDLTPLREAIQRVELSEAEMNSAAFFFGLR